MENRAKICVPFKIAPWIRKLASELQAAEPVASVRVHKDCISVKYKTGFRRSYIYKNIRHRIYSVPINEKNSACHWPIPMSYEHQWNPLDQHNKAELLNYFNVSRSVIDQCSEMELELLVQSIMLKITNGYIRPYITEAAIDAELERLNTPSHLLYSGNEISICKYRGMRWSAHKPAQLLIEKYWDISKLYHWRKNYYLEKAFTTPRIMFSAIRHIVHNTDWDINITTIHKALYHRKYGPRWYNPALFAKLLESIPMGGRTLVDGSPNLNEKIITAWLLDCKYASINGSRPPEKLIDRLGVEITDATQPYDVLVLDNCFKMLPTTTIIDSRKLCRDMLVYVQMSQAREVAKQLPPTKIIRVGGTPKTSGQIKSNYMFIYVGKNRDMEIING